MSKKTLLFSVKPQTSAAVSRVAADAGVMEMATLTCDIQSNPAPLFSWYKMVPGQNQRLYNGSRITITSQVPELLLLLIINWNLTCQLFWKFHGRESAKMTIFNRLFKQSCVRSKSYDNFHRGDVWKFIWFESPYDKTNKMACAPSEDSDQPGHLPSLIRVFTVCMKEPWVLSYPLSAQWRLIRLGDARLIWVLLGAHAILLVLSWGGSFKRKIGKERACLPN